MKSSRRRTLFPTVQEVEFLHLKLLEKFGGLEGVRDRGLLESSLFRPRSGYYPTLLDQAAALMQSLARNHSFIDGNKRIAFAVTDVFLRMNGCHIKVSPLDAERFLVTEVIQEHASVEAIAKFLDSHVVLSDPLQKSQRLRAV